jgi:hypothetical protein
LIILYSRLRGAAVALVVASLVAAPAAQADEAGSAAGDYSLFDPAPDNTLRAFCTDRPTKGTGPCTVDAGHLQIESDIFNASFQNSAGVDTDTFVYTSPNFRLGVSDNMDVELNLSPFIQVQTRDHRTGARAEISGFGDMVVRVKTSLVGNGSGFFSAAFDPFLKLPTAPIGIGNGTIEAGGVVSLQFALSEKWSVSLVPEIDLLKNQNDGGRHEAGVVALGLTRAVSSQVSASAELWADVNGDPAGTATEESFDLAATWQPPGTVDLQLDAGANIGLNAETPAEQIYVGISHRF